MSLDPNHLDLNLDVSWSFIGTLMFSWSEPSQHTQKKNKSKWIRGDLYSKTRPSLIWSRTIHKNTIIQRLRDITTIIQRLWDINDTQKHNYSKTRPWLTWSRTNHSKTRPYIIWNRTNYQVEHWCPLDSNHLNTQTKLQKQTNQNHRDIPQSKICINWTTTI